MQHSIYSWLQAILIKSSTFIFPSHEKLIKQTFTVIMLTSIWSAMSSQIICKKDILQNVNFHSHRLKCVSRHFIVLLASHFHLSAAWKMWKLPTDCYSHTMNTHMVGCITMIVPKRWCSCGGTCIYKIKINCDSYQWIRRISNYLGGRFRREILTSYLFKGICVWKISFSCRWFHCV